MDLVTSIAVLTIFTVGLIISVYHTIVYLANKLMNRS